MTQRKSARNKPRRAGRRANGLEAQLALPLARGRGGARPGAGRPRSGKEYVPHRRRPGLSRHEPLLVTVRLVRALPALRSRRPFEIVERAFRAANESGGLRLVHYSVQRDHVHMLVEVRPEEVGGVAVVGGVGGRRGAAAMRAATTRLLTARMRGFGVRMARRLNKLFGRRGRLVAERYHARALRTPREVRNALVYVLGNRRKHLAQAGRGFVGPWIDPFASGVFFDGWRSAPWVMSTYASHDPPPVVSARTHLLRRGWLRHGRIDPEDVPAAAALRAQARAATVSPLNRANILRGRIVSPR